MKSQPEPKNQLSENLRHKKFIIFDFDGTIADTMILGWQIANKLADRFGYRHVKKEEIAELRHKKTQEVLKSINLSLVKLPIVANCFRKELHKNIDKLQPIGGMKEVIKGLYEQGHYLVVATSNSQKNLLQFLRNHQLEAYFQHTLAGIRLFGKSKLIGGFLKKHKIEKGEVVLIGDETRDIEAAKQCGIEVISVSWGFNAYEILEKHHPDNIVNLPTELAKLFE